MYPTLSVNGLTFHHVLTATDVADVHEHHGAVVRYKVASDDLEALRHGVYLIVEDDEIVYVGAFGTSFRRRWLYTSAQQIYHHKRNAIAQSLYAGREVRVYAQTEETLRRQIAVAAQGDHAWGSDSNLETVELALIRRLQPDWN